MSKEIKTLKSLKPQVLNANKHTQRGLGLLEDSIQKDGWIGAITVAADGETFDGSARIETGAAAGFEDAIVVRSDGSKPIIHIREDIKTADDPKAKRLGIAANKIAQIDFDPDAQVLAQLVGEGIDLSDLYTADEFAALSMESPDLNDLFTEHADGESIPAHKIVLEYTEEEHDLVKEKLSDISKQPGQAVWKLLGL